MQRVKLGKTGIEVSRMCFGTLTVGPLQAKLTVEQGGAVLAYGIERGIDFFDTAQLYETYPYLHEAMRQSGKRDIVISSKTYAYTAELAEQAVEQARRELDRDYIDIFMLHEQESIHTLRGHCEALERMMEYKAKGVIRAVGASMHHIAAVEGAVQLGLDVIHPIINKAGLGIADGTREQMEKAIRKAHESGIGVFSMKALGGGNLFRDAAACFDYIKALPFVDSFAVGMQNNDEVDANIAYLQDGCFSQKAAGLLAKKIRRLHIDDWCCACGECVKRCGQKALSVCGGMARCDYSQCILCGYCATVCPMWAIKVV